VNVELGAVSSVTVPDGPVVTMCGHAERAATAASVLERAGRAEVGIMPGGPGEWAKASGGAVEVGA
jgi:rhodanese-related sulfurtransferase